MEGKAVPTTRCKFRCTSIETFEHGGVKVRLSAVYPQGTDGFKHSAEDHAFFNATPSGSVEMLIQNPYGAELFQPGADFYLDFTLAPKPVPAIPEEIRREAG